MTDAVRDSYDAKAKQYANFVLDDLDRVPLDREWLAAGPTRDHASAGFNANAPETIRSHQPGQALFGAGEGIQLPHICNREI